MFHIYFIQHVWTLCILQMLILLFKFIIFITGIYFLFLCFCCRWKFSGIILTRHAVIVEMSYCNGVAHEGVVHYSRAFRCVEELMLIIQVLSYYLSCESNQSSQQQQPVFTCIYHRFVALQYSALSSNERTLYIR